MAIRPRARSARLLVVTLIIVSVLTITLDYRQGSTGPLEFFGKTALAVLSPFQKAISKVTNPVGNFFSGLAHLPSLESQNQQLKQQLDATRAAYLKASSDQAQLTILQNLLQIKAALQPETEGALVIGSSVSNFEWTITIDKGSSSGVRPGAAVVASAGPDTPPGFTGGLVGHVVRVTPYSADVQLVIDPDSQVAGRLFSSGETGLVVGQGDKDMRMTLLSSSSPVKLDDIVSTVAFQAGDLQNRYPPGIVLGRVSRILPSAGSPDKYVLVRPTVDFSSLEYVLVVVQSGSPAP